MPGVSIAADGPSAGAAQRSFVDESGLRLDFDGAFVVAIMPAAGGFAFALGDGTVRLVLADGTPGPVAQAHDGAVLAAVGLTDGTVISAGDDGRVVRVAPDGVVRVLLEARGKWPTALAATPDGAVIGAAFGKTLVTLDGTGSERVRLALPASVEALAFDPRGKRLAAAHYGGVSLLIPTIAGQTPKTLKWKGNHVAVTWSPDGAFVVTGMQENALHGWRVADGMDFQMGGYARKVRAFSWLHNGRWLATGGAPVIPMWPFVSKDGPMGKRAETVGNANAPFAVLAAHPAEDIVAGGTEDGLLQLGRLGAPKPADLDPEGPAPISALAWSPDGWTLAFGREDGSAGLVFMPRG
jgi:WD40 repeat protein